MDKVDRIKYSSVKIGAWTGEISAQHLTTGTRPNIGYTSGIWTLQKALADLADGGYVIDNTVIAEHPMLTHWVFAQPLQDGRIEGDEIERFTEEDSATAGMMWPWMEGEFKPLAYLASKIRANENGEAGPMDRVSAAYIAAYWGAKGSKIGKRVGNTLVWNDGSVEAIVPREEQRT